MTALSQQQRKRIMAIRIFLNRPEHFDEFPEIEHQAMLDAWVEKQSILTIEHAYFDTLDGNPVIAIHPMYPNQIEDNTDTELLDDLIDDLAHNYSTMPRSFNEPTGLMTIHSALKSKKPRNNNGRSTSFTP
jgi:hypothetical protein